MQVPIDGTIASHLILVGPFLYLLRRNNRYQMYTTHLKLDRTEMIRSLDMAVYKIYMRTSDDFSFWKLCFTPALPSNIMFKLKP